MEEALTEFKRFTNDYLEYGEMITLKINHTHRVVELCENIAKSLNLTDEEIFIAKIIGLLHDIGRFEQWKVYRTYKDADSIDHANLGVEILKKDNYLRKFIKDDKYDDIILKSIYYHNKYEIPNDLSEKEELFIKIIRDADKIYILYIYTIKQIDLPLDNEFTKDIYESLLKGKKINRKYIHTKTDRLSVTLGFIFDINYKYSFEYLKDKKYFDTIVDIYKEKLNNEIFSNQLDEILKTINNYIEVNLC